MNLDDLARTAAEDANAAGRSMPIVPLEQSRRRRRLLTVVPALAAGALAWVVVALVAFPHNGEPPVISQVTTTTTPVDETEASLDDAAFFEWALENRLRGREDLLEVRLTAVVDRPELEGVQLLIYPTLQSGGRYAHQVRIDGTGDICGFLEGTFEIDGSTGRFLNDVFPEPDSMVVGASRPHFPYICKPDPLPGTVDAVLAEPFDLVLESGALTLSNSAGTVRFTTATIDAFPPLDVGWIRSGHAAIVDDAGVTLAESDGSIAYGRNVAWDGGEGFVVVTDVEVAWHTPEGVVSNGIPTGELIGVETTPSGAVVGIRSNVDGPITWYELQTGEPTIQPVEPVTTDGITYSVGVRTVTIDQPDWSDVPRGQGNELLGEFDLPELVITEDGNEALRITVGTTDRPYVRIDDFDGRRIIVVAEPLEPALPPMTAWIIDLECSDCTERYDTQGAEWFDLTGFLPTEGTIQTPSLP